MIVIQQELADCLGISRRRIRQLQREGILQREAEGYILEDCVKAYIDYKVSFETGRRAAASKEELQAEHEKVKIQISKERLRRIRRESLDADAVEATWTDWLTFLRSQLDDLPAKIVMSIAGEDMNAQISIVTGIIEDLEKQLREYDPGDYETGAAGGYFDEEDDEEEGDEEEW